VVSSENPELMIHLY